MRVQFCACPQFGVAVEVCGERGDALAALWDLGTQDGAVMTFCREGESKANLAAGVRRRAVGTPAGGGSGAESGDTQRAL